MINTGIALHYLKDLCLHRMGRSGVLILTGTIWGMLFEHQSRNYPRFPGPTRGRFPAIRFCQSSQVTWQNWCKCRQFNFVVYPNWENELVHTAHFLFFIFLSFFHSFFLRYSGHTHTHLTMRDVQNCVHDSSLGVIMPNAGLHKT